MANLSKKQRSKILSTGSIPMATAVIAAMGMPSVHAQPNDNTTTNNTDSHGRVALAGTQPTWATPATAKGAVQATQTISTRIYLTGQNQDQFQAMAQAISDPASAAYHHYLSTTQVQSQFGATPEQIKTVVDWAKGAGLNVTSVSDNWIDAEGPASVMQAAFSTQLASFTAPDGQSHYAPASTPTLPAAVAHAVAGVSGLYDVPKAHAPSSLQAPKAHPASVTYDTSWCSTYWGEKSAAGYYLPICGYTPSQIRSGYGVANSGLTGKGATVAIVDAYGSSTMAADESAYNAQFHEPQFRPGQYTEVENPSAFRKQAECAPAHWAEEQTMDVEAVHAMAPDANVVYVAANSCEDPDLMAAMSWVVDTHAADIVSDSIGGLQYTSRGNVDPATRAAYDRIFMKGALEGIGFNFSTGDCGDDDPANAATGGNCAPDSNRRQTEWPANSAWVTATGGTSLAIDGKGNYQSETAWGDWLTGVAAPGKWGNGKFSGGAGGGTSAETPQPWYQRGIVPTSMSNTLPTGQPTGPMRTVPDIALDASPSTGIATFQTINGKGDWSQGGGTSLASPLFAGMEALQKQAHGGVAPGFENPTIYANANKFHDVTQNNGNAVIYPQAYDANNNVTSAQLMIMGDDTSLKAGPGYDEATGLGSPTLGFLQAPYNANRAGRIAGPDRYATGIQVSQQQYPAPGSANAVVLATGVTFPDALAGVPLAKKVGGPLLLTPGDVSDPQVVAEIHRVLKPGGMVYVLGGAHAITPAVVNGLGLPANRITRIGGVDRYDTALKIAGALGNPSHVVLATGAGFADALAAGPYASTVFADNGRPAAILLTEDKVMNPAVAAYVHGAKAVAAVGGQAVAAANSAHIPGVVPFAGSDRFDTAARVAGTFKGEHTAGVATGLQFADALTGAAQLAQVGGPLVLSNVTNLPPTSAAALHGINASLGGAGLIEIFGGPVAINNATEYAIAAAAGAIVEG